MRSLWAPVLASIVVLLLVGPMPGTESGQPAEIHLKHTEPHTVAAMRHQGPYTEVPQVVGELLKAVDEGGYHIAGPVMVAYFDDPSETPEEDLVWEVRIPVTYPGPMGSAENDRMAFKYLDPAFVAYTYHVGSFEDVESTYWDLLDWIGRNQYQVIGPPVEVYWSDPDKVPEDGWVTEVWFPVLEKETPQAVVK
jgi:effector-binding domain-containing protein